MPTPLILMVDNHTEFLDTRAEYIEQAGYRLSKASSAEAARLFAEQQPPDLAVVDVRLVNDEDDGDYTGVFLAQSLRQVCPVIILTDHANFVIVRQTLIQYDQADRLYTVNFFDKSEGPAVLIQSIGQILQDSQRLQKSTGIPRKTWRVIRIIAFSLFGVTILSLAFIAQRDDKTALVVGMIFAGLQVMLAGASLAFEKKA